MKNKLKMVCLVAAMISLGYFLRVAKEEVTHEQQKAIDIAVAKAKAQWMYENVEQHAKSFDMEINITDDEINLLEPRISQNLVLPWDGEHAVHIGERPFFDAPLDYKWAMAYWMKNHLHRSDFHYQEGMTDQKQDEMIRFLCYMIEFSGMHPRSYNGTNLFLYLNSYPRVFRPEHTAMLTRAVRYAVASEDTALIFGAFDFLSCHLSLEWAAAQYWQLIEICSGYRYDPSIHFNPDPLSQMLACLHRRMAMDRQHDPWMHAKGGEKEGMAAAASMLDRFRTTDWDKMSRIRDVTLKEWKRLNDAAKIRPTTRTSPAN